jgi:glutaredoxin 3
VSFSTPKLGGVLETMIKIYTTNTCAYCKMVKQFLTMKGKDYEVINLDEQPDMQAEAFAISGALTVPVTTDGSSVVIGWNPGKLLSLA